MAVCESVTIPGMTGHVRRNTQSPPRSQPTEDGYAMSKSNLHALSQPEATTNDPLHDLIRQGARDLIARAVESELQGLLDQYADVLTPDGRKAVVRNGHLPKRSQFMLMWRLLAY
jgi:hypothetical protein